MCIVDFKLSFDYFKNWQVEVKLAAFIFKTNTTDAIMESWHFSAMLTLCRFWHSSLKILHFCSACHLGVKCLSKVRGGIPSKMVLFAQDKLPSSHSPMSWVWSACLPKIFNFFFRYMYVYVCLCEFVCTVCVQCLWRPDKGIGAIGAEVTGGFEHYHMDTGNLTEPWSVRAGTTSNHCCLFSLNFAYFH